MILTITLLFSFILIAVIVYFLQMNIFGKYIALHNLDKSQTLKFKLNFIDFVVFSKIQYEYIIFCKILKRIKVKGAYEGLNKDMDKIKIHRLTKLYLIRDLANGTFDYEKYISDITHQHYWDIFEHFQYKFGITFKVNSQDVYNLKPHYRNVLKFIYNLPFDKYAPESIIANYDVFSYALEYDKKHPEVSEEFLQWFDKLRKQPQ